MAVTLNTTDLLTTALNNIAAQLANMTASPKPSYSIAGRSISWDEHFAALTARYSELQLLRLQSQDAFEIRSLAET